ETGHELVALVALVAAGPKVAQAAVVRVGLGVAVGVVAAVAEQGHGAGGGQAGIAATGAVFVVGGIGLDGQALGLVEGNAPGRVPGAGGDNYQMAKYFGLAHGPFQR
nr:hypothetical protein [Tanacetum cinerariifolium]